MRVQTDVVIIGGGIAGLWTMHTLKKQGFRVILLESDSLGSGQTVKSQGIIHGGLKYALSGSQNAASNALKDMPLYWQDCLEGIGEVNLRMVKVLSDGQFMWSVNKLSGGITTLFASNAMRSDVTVVPKEKQPAIIRDSAISGKLYKLQEIVLNIPSLLNALAKPNLNDCIKVDTADGCKFGLDPAGNIQFVSFTSGNFPVEITAQRYIFTAGTGNAQLQQQLGLPAGMQRRPLHMVLLKSKQLTPLFGHCVGMSSAPRLTITTHIAKDHIPVWYLGGKLAEDGVTLTPEQQIKVAQSEVAKLFPNLDLSDAKWTSFYVDRAEEMQADGSKPTSYSIVERNNYITAWPTKLALAPVLAQQILKTFKKNKIEPNFQLSNPPLEQYLRPKIAEPIWDQLL